MKLLKNNEYVLSDPQPNIAIKEFADSAVILTIRPWIKTENYWKFYWYFQKNTKTDI